MKKKFFLTAAALVVVPLTCVVAQADDVTTLIDSAKDNYAAHKYTKAIEDLEWAKKEIMNRQIGSVKDFLPAEIDGMKGVDVEEGAVLGVRGVSRKYGTADGSKSVVISFVSGEGSAAANGLGALMKMAASLGAMEAGTSSKLVIAKGYKGQFVPEGKQSGTLTFNLNGGRMVTIQTTGYQGASMAEKVAKNLDLSKIEETF